MLKQYMLKKNKEFAYVHRKGASCAGRYLVLVYVKNRMGLRLGFSVSKKLGNAVRRNRIKRLLRECARVSLNNMKPGYSYLFIARLGARDASYSELLKDMDIVLKRARLLLECKTPEWAPAQSETAPAAPKALSIPPKAAAAVPSEAIPKITSETFSEITSEGSLEIPSGARASLSVETPIDARPAPPCEADKP